MSESAKLALAELTTMGVGGVPAEMHEANSREELIDLSLQTWKSGEDWLLLGGGSNIVAADDLEELHVIRVRSLGIETDTVAEKQIWPARQIWRVQAGESWDGLVAKTVEAGLAGLEAMSGIPGSVGAAPVQNIGAYGQEVAETIARVEFLDYQTRELHILENSDLDFGYRDSAIKRGRQGVITWVEFELENHGGLSKPTESTQVAQALGLQLAGQAPLAEIRDVVLGLRAAKGMIYDPHDQNSWSCGSFFTNPIVSHRFARTMPAEAPRWETAADDGLTVKLSAAWLIENSGFSKGYSIAGSKAAISSKHSLAIVNRGGASAQEVVQLASLVQSQVMNRFGINLVPEPNLIGF